MNKIVRDIAPATPRKGFTKKQRAEAFLAAEGKCGLCAGKIIGQYDIDHIIALDHGGAHEPSNWRVVHRACHIKKTRDDVRVSAKIKRIQKRESGERRERQAIPSRGFDKRLTKGFDGKVRVRSAAWAILAVGLIAGGLGGAYLSGRADAVSSAPGRQFGYDYEIRNSLGGDLRSMVYTVPGGIRVGFTGICASACSYFADIKARGGQACITRRTVMFYHAVRVGGEWIDNTDHYYRPEVAEWVFANGGFPKSERLEDATAMRWPDTGRFWPLCGA